MAELSLMANVYFIGPVVGHEVGDEEVVFYFACVAVDEIDDGEEKTYLMSRCWFISHSDISVSKLKELKWGDRLVIAATISDCPLAQELFQERNGWHATSIHVISRGHGKIRATDIELPKKIDLPDATPLLLT